MSPGNDRGGPREEAARNVDHTDRHIISCRRRRVLEVELAGVASVVRGPGSRNLVIQVTGRPPVWRAARRGWSVQERTASDVVAAAERLNYDILITGRRAAAIAPTVTAPLPEQPDPGSGLW